MKLGKSQRDKQETEVASVACFNQDGKLLFGQRADTGKWGLPGGHLEPGENPEHGAIRELLEEVGLRPESKSFEKLGEDVVVSERGKTIRVHAYRCTVAPGHEPGCEGDPDEEFQDLEFVDPKYIPTYILENLHAPRNVTLRLLGLHSWELSKAEGDETFYHGSPKNFKTFKFKPSRNVDPFGGKETVQRHALFFTKQPELAQAYAQGASNAPGYVRHVKLDMKNPADLREGLNNEHYEALRRQGVDVRPLYDIPAHETWRLFDNETGKHFVNALRSMGHDSAIMTEPDQTENGYTETHAVFDPKQAQVIKSEDLDKMALKDVKVGSSLPSEDGAEAYDYSHLLPEGEHQKGLTLKLFHRAHERNPMSDLHVSIRHGKVPVGFVRGHVSPDEEGNVLTVEEGNIFSHHRSYYAGRGLGTAAYEALMAHAKNVHKCHAVTGDLHSTSAMRVHAGLAEKHGLDYKPKRSNSGEPRPGPFDDRYSPYQYELKSEVEKAEREPPVELEHYSPMRGLKTIDPTYQGTGAFGIHGGEAQRTSRIPRSYYYLAGTQPESTFKSGHMQRYAAKLPPKARLYDIGKDPDNLLAPKVRHTDYGIMHEPVDLDEVEKKIRKRGYHGYKNYHPSIPNAVAVFYPLRARPMALESNTQQIDQGLGKTDVEVLMQHPSRAERQMALKLQGVTQTDVRRGVEDPDAQVALSALKHPLVDVDVLRQALAHSAPNVRIAALQHQGIDAGHIEQALADLNPMVLEALARHPKLEPDHIRQLLERGHPQVLSALAHRPDLTPEHAVSILVHPQAGDDVKAHVSQDPHVPEALRQVVGPLLRNGLQRHAQEWLDLRKGGYAAKRWPSEGKYGLSDETYENAESWVGEGHPERRYHLATEGMPANDISRTLHKLHGKTQVRVNPESKKREFLLHRAMSAGERQGGLSPDGKRFRSGIATSWTPNLNVANLFGNRGGVMSAWIPEDAIRFSPNQAGAIAHSPEEEMIVHNPQATTAEGRLASSGFEVHRHYPQKVIGATGEYDRKLPGNIHERVNANADAAKARQWYQQNAPEARTLTPEAAIGDTKKILAYRNKPVFKAEDPHQPHEEPQSVSAEAAHQTDLGDEDIVPMADPDFVDDFEGHSIDDDAAFAAARFLSGDKPRLPPEEMRHFVWEADDDVEAAALRAYGMEPDEEHRRALRGVLQASGLAKGDPDRAFTPVDRPEAPQSVQAMTPSGEDVAKVIQEAFREKAVEAVSLKGKHTKGTMIAHDKASKDAWLLKPGSGNPSPAKGIAETQGSQSAREACFYACAKHVFGLEAYVPQCELLDIDGKAVAAMKFLPPQFKGIEKRAKEDSMRVLWSLHMYLKTGALHKWAVMDGILGQVDRHGQNLLANKDLPAKIFLIDAGSTFAGDSFSPGHDKSSFVPYYLRAWSPRKFNTLPPEERLRRMPRADHYVEALLRDWVVSLSAATLEQTITRFGLDPGACLRRLARLRAAVVDGVPVDLTINRMWCGLEPWETLPLQS